MVCNFIQFLKMPSFRFSNLFGRVAVVKEEHLENASSPIVVTLFGIVIEVKEEHPENA